jgi:hypothetical protein
MPARRAPITSHLGVVLLCVPLSTWALPDSELALWVGQSFRSDTDFDRVELVASWSLPWRWERPSGWVIESRALASVGALRARGDTSALVSLGVGANFDSPSGRWRFEAGLRPTLLEDDDYGGYQVGGRVHFTSHVGVTLQLTNNFGIGYRLSHLSNAELDRPNPGVDTQQLALVLRF